MPATDRSPDEIVTDHCALRYLERVLDVEIGSDAAHGETSRLFRLCRDLGITTTALKAAILAPPVRAALDAGASRAFYGGVWIAFAQGRATTILDPAIRYERSRSGKGHKLRYSPQLPTYRRAAIRQSEDAEL